MTETYCSKCREALPSLPSDAVVHCPVFEADGTLDYIELAHRTCAPSWSVFDAWPKGMTDAQAQATTRWSYYTPEKTAELEAAFNRVSPAGNWKMAIDITLRPALTEIEQAQIAEAVTFYTGSVATFTPVYPAIRFNRERVNGTRVQAAGYYATIGA